MEGTVETLIDVFLTRCGKVFTSTQFDVPFDRETREGGSSPDIIALDFGRHPKEVVIVEVTTSSSLASLSSRIAEREKRWYRPLRKQLIASGVIDETWTLRVLAFVRETNVTSAKKAFAADDDVTFYAIEEAILPYRYWKSRIDEGLPGALSPERVAGVS